MSGRLAIDDLRHGQPDAEQVAAFADGPEFPLIEGLQATFVWRGEADAVQLRHFIYGLPAEMPFSRIEGTDLWYCVVEVPERSRIEYKLNVIRHGDGEWIQDPRNPHLAQDPFGANSVCHGHGYQRPAWIEQDPEVCPGVLEEHMLAPTPFGEPRRITLYKPARMRATRRYPLLIAHDGGDYLKYASAKTVLDNLIHRDEVLPLVVAFTHPVERLVEYPDDPRHVAFVAQTLLPWLEERLPLYGTPETRGLMGASFGAVASLAIAWRHPCIFDRLLLQSGSFAFTEIGNHSRGPAFDPVVDFMNRFRAKPGKPSQRIYMSCGTYETLIFENRSIVPLLERAGMAVRYREAPDGHNWENWRDRLREGLSSLFPGHLWMTYE